MIVENMQLNTAVDAIKATMVQCKELKNAGVLRKLTDFKAEINNKTWWWRKNIMLIKWLRIREDLITVSNDQESTIKINSGSVFKNRVIKLSSWMEEVDIITVHIQTDFILIADG